MSESERESERAKKKTSKELRRKNSLSFLSSLFPLSLKKNQTSGEWQFWAFFGAAGCASSLASHLGRLAAVAAASRSLSSRVAAALGSAKTLALGPSSSSSGISSGGGSLGASGSLYACVALAALDDPDTRVAVPFLEGLGSFSIGEALLAILAVDVVGVARGWRRLDHWGHLGGAAAGAAWGSGLGDDVWRASLTLAEGLRAWGKKAREKTERKRRERERRRREVEREEQRRKKR